MKSFGNFGGDNYKEYQNSAKNLRYKKLSRQPAVLLKSNIDTSQIFCQKYVNRCYDNNETNKINDLFNSNLDSYNSCDDQYSNENQEYY